MGQQSCPAIVRQLGLREGTTVEAQLTVDGSLSMRPAQ